MMIVGDRFDEFLPEPLETGAAGEEEGRRRLPEQLRRAH
jgi:hypothetical protein